ncbi:MAG: hypothetical protein A2Y17_11475 [Clostridiales bacterium GWF2_38_85]|nr:MAG: hypothetical protein A2Y17_11475 [Clostridiales bacterium GWF2_38_85]HBL85093.1 hypothetical protein [Clostridiales bacterium]
MSKCLAGGTSSDSVSLVDISISNEDRCKWKFQRGPEGVCEIITNKYTNKVLYNSGTSISTQYYNQSNPTGQIWRAASVDYYSELNSSFYISNMEINIDETKSPIINKIPSNALWVSPSDFSYSFNNTIVSTNNLGQITGGKRKAKNEAIVITATHNVTGISKTFSVTVKSSMQNVFNNIGILYNIAKNYNSSTSQEATLLTLQFIRREKYNTINWDTVAGNIDNNFVTTVYNTNSYIYEYFSVSSDSDLYIIDPSGGIIDFVHLCATLNGLIYDS